VARFDSVALLRNKEFAALASTAFVRSQAYSTIIIALALYADIYRTTGFVEGLFGTAFALVQLIIVLPLGRKVDTGNAKHWLLAGFAINVGVFVGFIFVQSPVHVILVRMLQGLGASILWITGASVVGQISPDESQGRWLGSYNQVAAVASMVGDLVGGYLLYAYGFVVPYLVLTALTLLSLVVVWLFLRDDPGGHADPGAEGGIARFRSLLALPMLRALLGFRMSFSFGKMAVMIFLPIYAITTFGINPLAVGGIMAGGRLAKALFQGIVGNLTDRWGREHYFVAVGALLYGVGTAAIPLAAYFEGRIAPITVPVGGDSFVLGGAFFALFGAYSILGVADSIRLPASMSLFIQEGTKYDSVASAMSLRSITWKVGQVLGPVLVGTTMDLVDTEAGFYLAAAFIAVATAGFAITSRRAHAEATAVDRCVPGD